MLNRKYQVGLIAVAVLAAYYPAVLAGASRIDDATLIASLSHSKGLDLHAIFFPSIGGGFYYRPVLILSYILDKYLFALLPSMMHVENILLHLLNAILIFFITRRLIPIVRREQSPLPLVAALLFGLHPITTESVNWISGRTDVLTSVFVLSCTLSLLLYRENQNRGYALLGMAAFLCAVLSKETALAFFPGALLIMFVRDHGAASGVSQPQKRGHVVFVAAAAVSVVLLFFVFRSLAFTSNTSRIGITLRCISDDWIHSLLVVLRTIGFYAKKSLFPFPLNFAIMAIDPLYELLAVPVIVSYMIIVSRRTMPSALFASGALVVAPAFLIAFGQIAWTPYAERYLYLPTSLIIIASVIAVGESVPQRHRVLLRVATVLLLSFFFVGTFSRSLVWRNDITLCEDTLAKSPLARDIRVTYAGILAEQGRYADALRQVDICRKIPSSVYDERIDLTSAYVYYKQGFLTQALDHINAIMVNTSGQSIEALKGRISIYESLKVSANPDTRRRINVRLFADMTALYERTQDTQVLYDLSTVAHELHDRRKELAFLQQCKHATAPGDPFRLFIENRILRESRGTYAGNS